MSENEPRAANGDVQAETFEALGRMTAAFGQLELLVTFLLHALIGDSEIAMALYETAQFRTKLDKCAALFPLRVKDEQVQKTFTDLAGRLQAANTKRNDYSHSMWATSPETVGTPMPRPIRISVRNRPRTRDGELQTLRGFVLEIADLSDEVRKVMPHVANAGHIPKGTLFHI